MARCKLTNMNLRNIRKSREYQCMIIDLVKVGVVTKSAAESLLDYTIPSGLLGETGSSSGSSGSGEETGGESQGSGSGAESGDDTGITVTLLYSNKSTRDWMSEEYTPNSTNISEESEAIIAAAKTAFGDDTINHLVFVELNPNYVEGKDMPVLKYPILDPQPTELTDGALLVCAYVQPDDNSESDPGSESK